MVDCFLSDQTPRFLPGLQLLTIFFCGALTTTMTTGGMNRLQFLPGNFQEPPTSISFQLFVTYL